MAEENQPKKPLKDVEVTSAPAHVRALLKQIRITIPIAQSFDAIEAVLLEAQRNLVKTTTDKADLPAAIIAIDHLLTHFRLFRDQGVVDQSKVQQFQATNR